MIVRVLHEGQYELPGDGLGRLKELDDALVRELAEDDEEGFEKTLGEILTHVRSRGRKLKDDELRESDLILPGEDFDLEEVRSLFNSQL